MNMGRPSKFSSMQIDIIRLHYGNEPIEDTLESVNDLRNDDVTRKDIISMASYLRCKGYDVDYINKGEDQ